MEIKDLKVGDIIVPNDESASKYSITVKKHNCICKVKHIYIERINVEVISINHNKKENIGHNFLVLPKYFDLKEKRSLLYSIY